MMNINETMTTLKVLHAACKPLLRHLSAMARWFLVGALEFTGYLAQALAYGLAVSFVVMHFVVCMLYKYVVQNKCKCRSQSPKTTSESKTKTTPTTTHQEQPFFPRVRGSGARRHGPATIPDRIELVQRLLRNHAFKDRWPLLQVELQQLQTAQNNNQADIYYPAMTETQLQQQYRVTRAVFSLCHCTTRDFYLVQHYEAKLERLQNMLGPYAVKQIEMEDYQLKEQERRAKRCFPQPPAKQPQPIPKKSTPLQRPNYWTCLQQEMALKNKDQNAKPVVLESHGERRAREKAAEAAAESERNLWKAFPPKEMDIRPFIDYEVAQLRHWYVANGGTVNPKSTNYAPPPPSMFGFDTVPPVQHAVPVQQSSFSFGQATATASPLGAVNHAPPSVPQGSVPVAPTPKPLKSILKKSSYPRPKNNLGGFGCSSTVLPPAQNAPVITPAVVTAASPAVGCGNENKSGEFGSLFSVKSNFKSTFPN